MSPNIISNAQDINTKLDTIVLSEWHDNTYPDLTGLTIYLPNKEEIINSQYSSDIDFLVDTRWDDFVEIFVSDL